MSLSRVYAGIALAAGLWAFIFRSRKGSFWARMALGAGTLAAYSIANTNELRRSRTGDLFRGGDLQSPAPPPIKPSDPIVGILSAAGLWLIFQIGDRLARRILPAGENEIEAIYALRGEAPRPIIAALLLTIVAPGEELFWQGMVQRAFMGKWGRVRGTAATVGAYGAVHILTGNLTLAAAATTAGAYWGTEYAVEGRLAPTLISHVIWDIWIFLIAPTETGKDR
ncbi:MAG TPA: CPBP family intramembrane glutamic endopeptidase [Chloroflexota bacterium]|nr:CPBP family intramembrane glutamic endopeptidase [Chloroflexota bacterium]